MNTETNQEKEIKETPPTPKSFFNLDLRARVVLCVSIIGFFLAVVVGMHQVRYEKNEAWIKASYETQSISSSINHQILRARETARLFQSTVMLSPILHDETKSSTKSKTKSDNDQVVLVPLYTKSDEASLASLYSSINPQTLLPSFQTFAILRPQVLEKTTKTSDKVFKIESSYPVKKELLNQRWPLQLKDQEAFNETAHTNFVTVSFPQQDVSWVIFNLPLISRGQVDGIVAMGFSLDYIFNKAKNSLPSNTRKYDFVVWDITSDEPLILYRSKTKNQLNQEEKNILSKKEEGLSQVIPVGNRLWRVDFYKKNQHLSFLWPLLTGFLILLASLLVSLLLYKIISNKDMAESRATQMFKKLLNINTKFKHVTENLPGIVVVLKEDGTVVDINKSGREMLNLNIDETSKSKKDINLAKFFNDSDFTMSLASLEVGETISLPVKIGGGKKQTKHFNISLSKVLMDDDIFVTILGSDVTSMVDLSQQIDVQSQQLHFLATHDQLTGLFNRRAFEDKIDYLLQSEGSFSLLYVDLDQFKIVNDTAGHLAGDKLLQLLSEEIQEKTRGMFARLGGDEFGMLIEGDAPEALIVAQQIIDVCKNFVFLWEGTSYQVTASIGLSDVSSIKTVISRPINKEDLMSRADAACYTSKKKGRNRVHVFSNEGESLSYQQEMEWTVKITEAIAKNKMVLYRQDISPLDLSHSPEKKSPHFEILTRMFDENNRAIPASEFVPAIERFGLHLMFDKWVLSHALNNFDKLHDGEFELCSINVSGQTIDDPEFETFLFQLIKDTKIDPRKLCLEITETAAINNMEKMKDLLPKIKAIGCKLALDDFGVGMSSFSYLKNFNVDYLKIDGSFIRDIENNDMSSSIVSAVTDIAHKMGIMVVAEWVSSENVASLLKEKGVDYGQGYYLGKPEPIDTIHY